MPIKQLPLLKCPLGKEYPVSLTRILGGLSRLKSSSYF
jgi:hypothetical protein